MATDKPYNYGQMVLLPISLEDQLMPGTLEWAIHALVERRVETAIFDSTVNGKLNSHSHGKQKSQGCGKYKSQGHGKYNSQSGGKNVIQCAATPVSSHTRDRRGDGHHNHVQNNSTVQTPGICHIGHHGTVEAGPRDGGQEYEQSMSVLRPLLDRIHKTDRLIDQIVYQLYGLTEEEIRVVEGNGA